MRSALGACALALVCGAQAVAAGAEAPALQPQATLTLPRPKILPCARFGTVELDVQAPDGSRHDPRIAVEWEANRRGYRVVAQEPAGEGEPLELDGLPEKLTLLAPQPVANLNLTLTCAGDDPEDPRARTLLWACSPSGCEPNVSYRATPRAAKTPHLRLCSTPESPELGGGARCPSGARDLRPAFRDPKQAVALAHAILDDARHVVDGLCRGNPACAQGFRARLVSKKLAAAKSWTVDSYALDPGDGPNGEDVGLSLKARGGGTAVALTCTARKSGGEQRCTLQLLDGAEVALEYVPIAGEEPGEALLDLADGSGARYLPAGTGDGKSEAVFILHGASALSLAQPGGKPRRRK